MGRGQVALYVLVGVVLVLIVSIGVLVMRQRQASLVSTASPDDASANDPALAAEKVRMQARVDACLGVVADDAQRRIGSSGAAMETAADAEQLLEQQIAVDFPRCFFAFNTVDKLEIVGDEPAITAVLGAGTLQVLAKLEAEGTFNAKTYRLSDYQASVPSSLLGLINAGKDIAKSLAGKGTGGRSFFTSDGKIDPYAFEDQGIYTQYILFDDGSCVVIMYDFNELRKGKAPLSYPVPMENCVKR
jgi:hypothetical protein